MDTRLPVQFCQLFTGYGLLFCGWLCRFGLFTGWIRLYHTARSCVAPHGFVAARYFTFLVHSTVLLVGFRLGWVTAVVCRVYAVLPVGSYVILLLVAFTVHSCRITVHFALRLRLPPTRLRLPPRLPFFWFCTPHGSVTLHAPYRLILVLPLQLVDSRTHHGLRMRLHAHTPARHRIAFYHRVTFGYMPATVLLRTYVRCGCGCVRSVPLRVVQDFAVAVLRLRFPPLQFGSTYAFTAYLQLVTYTHTPVPHVRYSSFAVYLRLPLRLPVGLLRFVVGCYRVYGCVLPHVYAVLVPRIPHTVATVTVTYGLLLHGCYIRFTTTRLVWFCHYHYAFYTVTYTGLVQLRTCGSLPFTFPITPLRLVGYVTYHIPTHAFPPRIFYAYTYCGWLRYFTHLLPVALFVAVSLAGSPGLRFDLRSATHGLLPVYTRCLRLRGYRLPHYCSAPTFLPAALHYLVTGCLLVQHTFVTVLRLRLRFVAYGYCHGYTRVATPHGYALPHHTAGSVYTVTALPLRSTVPRLYIPQLYYTLPVTAWLVAVRLHYVATRLHATHAHWFFTHTTTRLPRYGYRGSLCLPHWFCSLDCLVPFVQLV